MANALLYYLIVINVVTFLVYGIDKWKAKKGSWRISEATLLILAAIGFAWNEDMLSGPCGCTERKGIRVSLVPFRVISGFRFV